MFKYQLLVPITILIIWLLLAVLGPWLPLQPNQINLPSILHPPSTTVWLGYDDLGRPILDRLIMGARTSFFVAFWVILLSLLVGTLIGSLSGWVGGYLDLFMVRLIDVFLAFPGILLAIALSGLLGPGIENVVFALSVVGWVGYMPDCRGFFRAAVPSTNSVPAGPVRRGRPPSIMTYCGRPARKYWIMKAFTISIKNAHTSGTMMKARCEGP